MTIKRRVTLLLAAVAAALVLTSGIALAAVISCPGGLCFGTPEPDTISGSGVNDEIHALAGNDFVDGFAGNDEVLGDQDSDELRAAENSDVSDGGPGNDLIDGVTFDTPGSVDVLRGGDGNDIITAKDGNVDLINCGKGKRDKVNGYDPGLDTVSRSCERKSATVTVAVDAEAEAIAQEARKADPPQR